MFGSDLHEETRIRIRTLRKKPDLDTILEKRPDPNFTKKKNPDLDLERTVSINPDPTLENRPDATGSRSATLAVSPYVLSNKGIKSA